YGKIKQLLLRELVAADAHLHNGDAGGGIDDDQRRLRAHRKAAHRGLRNWGYLGQRNLKIGSGLEENFGDGPAIHRLRFNMLNIVNDGGKTALRVAHNAVCHLLGVHAAELPDNADDRNIDVWEDVNGRPLNHNGTEN